MSETNVDIKIVKAAVIDTIYAMLYMIADIDKDKVTKASWNQMISDLTPPIDNNDKIAANALVLSDQVVKLIKISKKKGMFCEGKRSIELVALQEQYESIMQNMRR